MMKTDLHYCGGEQPQLSSEPPFSQHRLKKKMPWSVTTEVREKREGNRERGNSLRASPAAH